MNELDTVVLLNNIKDHSLKSGDIGTIVHVYPDGKAYEVEFIFGQGQTVAVLTLETNEIRPLTDKEIFHVRELNIA